MVTPKRTQHEQFAFGFSGNAAQSFGSPTQDVSALEPAVQVILKGLQKRDSKTKAKATDDLIDFLRSSDGISMSESSEPFLKAFVPLYPALATDVEKRVRSNSHTVLGCLVKAFQKKMAKYLGQVAPYWQLGLYDGDRVVSRAATIAFESAFASLGKRQDFCKLFSVDIASRCQEIIFEETVESFTDPRFTSKDDAEARFTNISSAALLVLATLPARGGRLNVEELLSDTRFFKLLQTCDASVQNSGLRLLLTACEPPTVERLSGHLRSSLASLVAHLYPMNTMLFLATLQRIAEIEPEMLVFTEPSSKKSLHDRILKLIKRGPSPGIPTTYWFELKRLLSTISTCLSAQDTMIASLLMAYEQGMNSAPRSQLGCATGEYASLCAQFSRSGSLFAKEKFVGLFNRDLVSLSPLTNCKSAIMEMADHDLSTASQALSGMRLQATDLFSSRDITHLTVLKQWLELLALLEVQPDLGTSEDIRYAIISNSACRDSAAVAYPVLCYALRLLSASAIRDSPELISGFSADSDQLALLGLLHGQESAELVIDLMEKSAPIADQVLKALLAAHSSDDDLMLKFVELVTTEPVISNSHELFIWLQQAAAKYQESTDLLWSIYSRYFSHCNDEMQLRTLMIVISGQFVTQDPVMAGKMLRLIGQTTERLPSVLGFQEDEAHTMCSYIWQMVRLSDFAELLPIFGTAAPVMFSKAFYLSLWDEVCRADQHALKLSLLSSMAKLAITQLEEDQISSSLSSSLLRTLPARLPSNLRILHPLGSLISIVHFEVNEVVQAYDNQGMSAFLRMCMFLFPVADKMSKTASSCLLIAKEMLLANMQDSESSQICHAQCSLPNLDSQIYNNTDIGPVFEHLHNDSKDMKGMLADFQKAGDYTMLHFYEASALYRKLVVLHEKPMLEETQEALYVATTSDVFLRIAVSTALYPSLAKTKAATLQRNRIVSDLSGKPADEQSLNRLIQLNALMAADSEETLIPKPRLMLLIKTQLEAARTCELAQDHTYELLSLMVKLLPDAKSEYGTFWEICISWLHDVMRAQSCETADVTIQYSTLKLISWFTSNYAANDDLSEYWINAQSSTETLISNLFFACAQKSPYNQAHTLCTLIASRLMMKVKISNMEHTTSQLLPHLISSGAEHIQITAYTLQCQIVEEDREQMIMVSALAKEYEEVTVELPPALLSVVLDCPIEESDVDDAGDWLAGPQRGYFMAWLLIFTYFENTPLRMRMKLIDDLQAVDLVEPLLGVIFSVMKLGDVKVADISGIDKAITDLRVEEGKSEMLVYAARLYYQCLVHAPSLVRAWWIECKDRPLTTAVEQMTEKNYSLTLIQKDAQSLQSDQSKVLLKDENLSVRVSNGGRDIYSTYEIDEQKMEMAIRLPSNYPLRRVTVEGLQRIGVKDAQWRAWLLASQAVLTAQNGSILDAISLFQRNVSLHFEGVADCNICFSILSVQDKSLPSKKCQTCKNLFHSSCLFKWFKSSSQSRCPLCRTSFAF